MGQESVHILRYIQTGMRIAKWQMEIYRPFDRGMNPKAFVRSSESLMGRGDTGKSTSTILQGNFEKLDFFPRVASIPSNVLKNYLRIFPLMNYIYKKFVFLAGNLRGQFLLRMHRMCWQGKTEPWLGFYR